MNSLHLAGALPAFAMLAAAPGAQAPRPAPLHYAIERPTADLADADQSWATGINEDGTVVGSYRADAWKRTKAFAWRDGTVLAAVLPQPDDASAQPPVLPDIHRHVRATAINDAGVLGGDAVHRSFGILFAGFFTPIPSSLPQPPLNIATTGVFHSWVHGVSNTDPMLIVGSGLVPGAGPLDSVLRGIATHVSPTTGVLSPATPIPPFSGSRSNSLARAVNRQWVVVGWAEHTDGYRHAFRWEHNSGAMRDLGTLGGPSSDAHAIDDAGRIVGQADIAPGVHRACLWLGARVIDLGTLGGATSTARSINAHGHVVGWSWTASEVVHAFAWMNGSMWDLNDAVPPGSGWVLQYAESINARGQIAGWGRYRGETRAFVLTPQE